MLRKAGRSGFAQLARQTARDPHPFAFDLGPGFAPAFQRGRIVDKVDTNFGQHCLSIGFDDLKRFFAQDLKVRDFAFDIFGGLNPNRCPLGPARCASTPRPLRRVAASAISYISRIATPVVRRLFGI